MPVETSHKRVSLVVGKGMDCKSSDELAASVMGLSSRWALTRVWKFIGGEVIPRALMSKWERVSAARLVCLGRWHMSVVYWAMKSGCRA